MNTKEFIDQVEQNIEESRKDQEELLQIHIKYIFQDWDRALKNHRDKKYVFKVFYGYFCPDSKKAFTQLLKAHISKTYPNLDFMIKLKVEFCFHKYTVDIYTKIGKRTWLDKLCGWK